MDVIPSFAERRARERYELDKLTFRQSATAFLEYLDKEQRENLEQLIKVLA